MKLLILLLFFSFSASAQDPFHMVSFGKNGLGWSGAVEELDTRSGSTFKSVDYFLNEIALNYAYRISSRFQLGAFYEGSHSEYEFEKKTGGTSSAEIEVNTTGLFLIYNFNEDLNDAWYGGYSFAVTSYEEENSHDFQHEEGKAPFELDDITRTQTLFVGKRFSLRGFNVENLAFSPVIRFFYRTHGKDFDDQNVGNGKGISFEPIRFDLLF